MRKELLKSLAKVVGGIIISGLSAWALYTDVKYTNDAFDEVKSSLRIRKLKD